MAMACLRLVTLFPLRPLFSVPRFSSCIARSTFLPAIGLYLREDFFFVGIQPSPFCCMGSNGEKRGWAERPEERRQSKSANSHFGRQNVLYVHPLRRILAGVTGNAEAIAFAAIARIS